MKQRFFACLAVLLFSVVAPAFALRIQSQAISSLKVSQISSSHFNPEILEGKIWGPAPQGEVTHIVYRILDEGGVPTWEFLQAYARVFEGTEELDIPFEFDISDVLADKNSTVRVQMQKRSMDGAFAHVVAQGSFSLFFPKEIQEKRTVSRIEKMTSLVEAQNVVVRVQFKNLSQEGKFFMNTKLLSSTGELLEEIDSAKKTLLPEGSAEFNVLFQAPEDPGKYKVSAQVYSEMGYPVSGIKLQQVFVEGDFALVSSLQVAPEEYFYAGERAEFIVKGVHSSWGEPLTLDFSVRDDAGTEIFTREFPVQTNEIGQFEQRIEVPVYKETAQLETEIALRCGAQLLGEYVYTTERSKKIRPAEGQSSLSFVFERVGQEFSFGGPREKIIIVLSFLAMGAIIAGFVFLMIRIRNLHMVLLLGILLWSSPAFADIGGTTTGNTIYSVSPERGFTIKPGADDGFEVIRFEGVVDLSLENGTFPTPGTPTNLEIRFGEERTIQRTLTEIHPNYDGVSYDFMIEVTEATIPDGSYPLSLRMTWSGMPAEFEGELVIDFGTEGTSWIAVDGTKPVPSFEYFAFDGFTPLEADAFSKDPLNTSVLCDDEAGIGCGYSEDPFMVRGNFCSEDESYCLEGVDTFIICDKVDNCSSPAQIEINQYDPVAPTMSDFVLTQKIDGGLDATIHEKIKAVALYGLSLAGLDDPKTTEAPIELDTNACGASDPTSPFVEYNGHCQQKIRNCSVGGVRGYASYEDDYTECGECPPGYEEENGICAPMGCSHVSFPYCFDWIMNGRCETFPLCFNWFLSE